MVYRQTIDRQQKLGGGMRAGGQLASLTSLRAFAALFVIGYHLQFALPQGARFFHVARFGFLGVSFFFVLSGFVLAWTARPDDTARPFYLRRFARVYPMHLLTLLAVIALIPVLRPVVWTSLPANLFLLQTWTPAGNVFYSFNSVSWTLSCEAFFYATFPLVYALLRRVRWPLLGALLSMATMAVVMWAFNSHSVKAPPFIAGLPIYRLGEFIVGILLAVSLKRAAAANKRLSMPAPVVAIGLFLIAYAATVHYRSHLWANAQSWLVELVLLPLLALIIIACANRDMHSSGRAVLQSRVLLKLGAWSFALYMVHLPVLELLAKYVDHSSTRSALALGFVAVVAAITVAALAYEFYERPVERWIRARGMARLTKTSPTTTTPAPAPEQGQAQASART